MFKFSFKYKLFTDKPGHTLKKLFVGMWKTYFKTAFRSLKNQRFYALNNIIGLSLGFGASLFIFHYVSFEKRFDEHIPEQENKVRLTIDKYRGSELIVSGTETYVGSGPVLYEQLPEVESYTRTFNMSVRMNSVISYEPENGAPINLKLKEYYYADSSFLKFFGYDLIKGDVNSALSKPKTAVITESLAKVYFGNEDPMGKVLRYQDENLFDDEHVITGVIKDTPTNTHLPFKLLLSYNTFDTRTYPGNYKTSWKARKAYTYLKLNPHADITAIEAKLPSIFAANKELPADRNEVLNLQPLTAIHFTQGLSEEPVPTVNPAVLDFLKLTAVLILLIACINFINLSTASLMQKAEEVSVRKILGANKSQLILQYYARCFLINILAMTLALILLVLAWPALNDLTGITMPVAELLHGSFIRLILLSFVSSTVLSGFIPALLISSFNPVKVIGGNLSLKNGKWYRFALIVGQFTISFCLIMATLVIFKQLSYMQEQNLGFDMDQTIVVRVPGVLPAEERDAISSAYTRFMTEAKKHSSIANAAASLTIPGHSQAYRTGVHTLSDPDNVTTLRFNGSGPTFVPTFGMNILAGRNFREDHQYDIDSAILLSESAVAKLGFDSHEDAIGRFIRVPAFRLTREVVGVVNDFRLESVKTEIEPMAILCDAPYQSNFFSFKLAGGNVQESLDHIDNLWAGIFEGNPLDYFFLDDFFNQQYLQEKKLSHLFGVFGTLAVFLAAIGLLGLAAFTAQQRTKEIGVRKALGSSVLQVFVLLSSRFILLVLIASVIGSAVIFYFSGKWLNQFPLQTSVPPWLYLIPLILLLVVTFISISFQTMKASLTNPVDSLRYE